MISGSVVCAERALVEKEARLSGKLQLAGWHVVLALNKTPCFKGCHAAGDCFHLAVYGSPWSMWRGAGQEERGERPMKVSSLVVVPNSLDVL